MDCVPNVQVRGDAPSGRTNAAACTPGANAIGCPIAADAGSAKAFSAEPEVALIGATTVAKVVLLYPKTAVSEAGTAVSRTMHAGRRATLLRDPDAPGAPLAGLSGVQNLGEDGGGSLVFGTDFVAV